MIDKMNELYQEMLQNYEGGLSNTSTKKFDGIVASIASLLGIPEKDVYATGSGSRPGNLEVRLSQGVRATTHTIVGLGFIVDEKNDQENVTKLTNSALATCKKFLGRGKAHYDNIVILVESDGRLFASGIICNQRTSITEKLIDELQIDNIVEVSPASNDGDASDISYPLQTIFYGAPGTGKSYKTNEIAKKYSTIRTTFHPDSDYSTFVGAYKPTAIMSKSYGLNSVGETKPIVDPETGETQEERKIEYRFVKQAFFKAYVQAWEFFCEAENVDDVKPQFLVIEEINRGNCAQIFGDLFQLLDRNNYGFSDYPITADIDMQKQLKEDFSGIVVPNADNSQKVIIKTHFIKYFPLAIAERIDRILGEKDVVKKVLRGEILLLPDNLYIWATMNTSDQSLFPIDSAFKRRWEWKYVRICEGKKEDGTPLDYRIKFTVPTKGELPEEQVDVKWWDFVKAINRQIEDATKSEDKKLGFFFCKPDKKANDTDECNTIISAETFVGKVVFYLWQDVFKDYGFKSNIFKREDGNKISFHDFYPEDMVANKDTNPEGIDLALVKEFIQKVIDSNKQA